METQILLAISDNNVGTVLSEYLRSREFDVDLQSSFADASASLAKHSYDFCLVCLNDTTSQTLLISDIRRVCASPIYAFQPQFDKAQQIAYFEAGADDCMVLPFVPDLLICKMQALMRRRINYESQLPQEFTFGDVSFNSINQILTIQGKTIHLSAKENNVLLLLCRNSNQLVERSLILKTVWLADNYFNSRSLSVYINHLRHYFETSTTVRIMSIHGRGYKLCTQPEFG